MSDDDTSDLDLWESVNPERAIRLERPQRMGLKRPGPEVKDIDLWQNVHAAEQEVFVQAAIHHGSRRPARGTVLYHYTNAEAFYRIIQERTIWMTNAAYLNDERELSYPVDVAQEALHELASVSRGDMHERVLSLVKSNLGSHVTFKEWYVASFSSEGDVLSQWRAYCPHGGYSMGLDASILWNTMGAPSKAHVGPIIYDRGTQIRRIGAVIRQHVDLFEASRREYSSFNSANLHPALGIGVAAALAYEFVFFKSAAFAEEREWRIAQTRSPGDVVRFRERQGALTPYLVRKLTAEGSLLPIDRIYISPSLDTNLATHAATLLLREQGYPRADIMVRQPQYRLRYT